MFAHFDRAEAAHDALVRFDMEQARKEGEWLASHEEPGMVPVDSDQHLAFMHRYARQVADAQELSDAAEGLAQMGRTCGDCHRQNDVRPRFLMGTAPPTGSGAEAEMARHIWAADRMWEGLLAPDDFAWTSGAKALREGWLSPSEVSVEASDQQRVRELVSQVYELGVAAEATEDPTLRGEVYGKFLTTCAECHRLTGAIIR
jgi:mono/diheme cytochrome c family protein